VRSAGGYRGSMDSPLLLLDGIFSQDENGTSVLMDGVVRHLGEVLSPFHGREVEVLLHHHPPQPVDKTLPGGGSCLWAGHCPHGHQSRPGWLHHQTISGFLRESEDGWVVGESHLRLDLMPGHHGRLILLDSQRFVDPPADSSVENLVQEAEQMASLLESLKGVLRE